VFAMGNGACVAPYQRPMGTLHRGATALLREICAAMSAGCRNRVPFGGASRTHAAARATVYVKLRIGSGRWDLCIAVAHADCLRLEGRREAARRNGCRYRRTSSACDRDTRVAACVRDCVHARERTDMCAFVTLVGWHEVCVVAAGYGILAI
jgi:hypothetical protein